MGIDRVSTEVSGPILRFGSPGSGCRDLSPEPIGCKMTAEIAKAALTMFTFRVDSTLKCKHGASKSAPNTYFGR